MGTMKKMAICLCLVFAGTLSAQETMDEEKLKKEALLEKNKEYQDESISKIKITKYTVMSKFEPDYVAPADERVNQKKQRIVEAYRQKSILDTLSISDRKRKKLIRDLSDSPFSERLSKALIVETEFEDEE